MSEFTEQREQLLSSIRDADFVLIGIGSELQVQIEELNQIPNFSEKYTFLQEHTEYSWLIPYLIKYYLGQEYHQTIVKAYRNLKAMLKDKNYFIVSLSTDDLLRNVFPNDTPVVYPCGNYIFWQCAGNCMDDLFQLEQEEWDEIAHWVENKKSIEELAVPVCPHCGKELVFNQYGQEVYNERGYLDDWKRYTEWLQGTVNKKLCILELGVGMEFPAIIRWPWEKVCFYNQKSKFYRVHKMLYQIADDIADKGISIKCNARDFLVSYME